MKTCATNVKYIIPELTNVNLICVNRCALNVIRFSQTTCYKATISPNVITKTGAIHAKIIIAKRIQLM